jgi:hypothetical protein
MIPPPAAVAQSDSEPARRFFATMEFPSATDPSKV